MNNEANIILNKELRRDIDAIIQRLRVAEQPGSNEAGSITATGRSRKRSLVITKLQEAVMWLGMDLKAINDESGVDEVTVEERAREVYDQMRASDPEGMHVEWVAGGNSLKQAEARRIARSELNANPYPDSKDPSNTKINPTADGLKL